jgi:NAD(P)-dependent dehydrogenase (short-subunit alcohol dehydrogenase family)
MSKRWTLSDLPYLAGKTFVVTGANGGLGYETSLGLAGAGATVAMACRNQDKAREARDRILEQHPDADLELFAVDVSDLDSVRECADVLAARYPRIDALVNNAGVLGASGTTPQGNEKTFATNYLGAFALTGLLLDRLEGVTEPGRVVTVSSLSHYWFGWINWKRMNTTGSRSMWLTYGESKLANLMFHFELHRRLSESGRRTIAVAAHPGVSNTDIAVAGPRDSGAKVSAAVHAYGTPLVTQSPAMGALPLLYAAASDEASAGDYIGPRGAFELVGHPGPARVAARAKRPEDLRRLWELSVELTGVDFGGL